MSGQELRQEKEQELEPHVPAAFLPLPANEEASAVYKAIRPEPELSDIVNARGGLYLKIL